MTPRVLSRRQFVAACWAAATGAALPARSEPVAQIRGRSFPFKRVGELALQLDVFRPDDSVERPIAVLLHGAGLMLGSRKELDQSLFQGLLRAGLVVVTIDYRLAPESKLPEIFADIEDGIAWFLERGRRQVGAAPRLALVGASTGGFLSLAIAGRGRFPVRAVLSLYGYGDLFGKWLLEPNPNPRYERFPMSEQEAFQQVGLVPLVDSTRAAGDRRAFYFFCRRRGLWLEQVSGWNPHTQRDLYRPYVPIPNITRRFPPTLLIHGRADTYIPFTEAEKLVQAFQTHGVEHRLIPVPEGEHGLTGADPKRIRAAYREGLQFVRDHLRA